MKKTWHRLFLCAYLAFSDINAADTKPLSVSSEIRYNFNLSSAELDVIANDALQAFNVPGLAIAIVMNNELAIANGYGHRNVDEKLNVTENTLFPIASCTKAFTATLILKLAEEGLLTLDDPVKKHIPEFFLKDSITSENLKIRDLLAHRTGLARHDAFWIFSKLSSRNSILDLFHHLEPVYGINEEFQYNNLMYSIAGLVIEKITGLSWEDATSVYLLIPLNMLNSNTSIASLTASSDFSLPYAEIEGKVKQIPFRNAYLVSPGGGINSSVLEMSNWLQLQLFNKSYLKDEIIQPESLKKSRDVQIKVISNQGETIQQGYGLGWFVGSYRGLNCISHGGHIDGFSSDVSLLPEMNLGIVILTNSSTDGLSAVTYIRNQIVDKILGKNDIDWMKELLKDRNKIKGYLNHLKTAFEKTQNDNSTPLESLMDYIGKYEHPAYGSVEITMDENGLWLSYCEMTMPLYRKADLIFAGKFAQLMVYGASPYVDFIFIQDSDGTIKELQIPFESFRAAEPITFTKS